MSAPDAVRDALHEAYVDREGCGTSDAFDAAADAAYTATLHAAYWKLRQHADAYRNTKGYRQAQERWEQASCRDDVLLHKLSIHVHYARGIEAAACDIAEMLGIPEHEIEPTP